MPFSLIISFFISVIRTVVTHCFCLLDALSSRGSGGGYDTKHDTNAALPSVCPPQVVEKDGRSVGARTPDMADKSARSNQLSYGPIVRMTAAILEQRSTQGQTGPSESGDGSHAETAAGELSRRNQGRENFGDSLYPY
jgi:hypothetical protein